MLTTFKTGVVKMPAPQQGTGTVPRTVGAFGNVATAKANEFKVTVVGTKCPGTLVVPNKLPVTGQTVNVMINNEMLLQAKTV